MKKGLLLVIGIAIVLLQSTGCTPKPKPDPVTVQDTIPEDTAKADTTTVVKQDWDDIDTTTIVPVINVDSLIKANLLTVHFGLDSYELTDESREQVIGAATFLMKESTIRVRLDGHCDERGSSEYNMGLGEKRAQAVQKLLVDYGVDARRIETTSYGKEQPLAYGCGDDACHSDNRRVEYTVIQK